MHWLVYVAIPPLILTVVVVEFFRNLFAPPSKNTTWQEHVVSSSGRIEQLAPRLWAARAKGRPERTMVVYKLNSGGLLLHSVIALPEEDMKKLESLGNVQFIVVPNPFHRLDAHVYHLVRIWGVRFSPQLLRALASTGTN
jgi:hypothetical protein